MQDVQIHQYDEDMLVRQSKVNQCSIYSVSLLELLMKQDTFQPSTLSLEECIDVSWEKCIMKKIAKMG